MGRERMELYKYKKLYFPKAEYIEYKNANGDIVKIAKKKIPLKKKPKTEEDDEQHIENKMVDREDKKIYSYAVDNVPFASHFFLYNYYYLNII